MRFVGRWEHLTCFLRLADTCVGFVDLWECLQQEPSPGTTHVEGLEPLEEALTGQAGGVGQFLREPPDLGQWCGLGKWCYVNGQ